MIKNIFKNNNNKFKNTKYVMNFIVFFFQALIVYTLLGIWSMYVDKIIYGENKYLSNVGVAIILGLGTLVIHQTFGGILLFISFTIMQSVYNEIINNKVKINIFHVIFTILSLGFVFCIYFVHFYMEIYFQRPNETPKLFSHESLKYFFAGFLKPMIIVVILFIAFIIDILEKNNKVIDNEEQLSKSKKNISSDV